MTFIDDIIQSGEITLIILAILSAEALLDEELFVMLPRHSKLVAPRRTSLTIVEAAALPLILPTSAHGLRRRIAAEFAIDLPRPRDYYASRFQADFRGYQERIWEVLRQEMQGAL